MLKLYTEINDLNTIKRKYLVDLLKPLLPEKNFDKYGIKNVELILVTDKDEATVLGTFTLGAGQVEYVDKNITDEIWAANAAIKLSSVIVMG